MLGVHAGQRAVILSRCRADRRMLFQRYARRFKRMADLELFQVGWRAAVGDDSAPRVD